MHYPMDRHPLLRTIMFTWDEVFARHYPPDPEIFLNPADWDEIGRPVQFSGVPVRRSLGIARGTVRVFDRETLRYLPEMP